MLSNLFPDNFCKLEVTPNLFVNASIIPNVTENNIFEIFWFDSTPLSDQKRVWKKNDLKSNKSLSSKNIQSEFLAKRYNLQYGKQCWLPETSLPTGNEETPLASKVIILPPLFITR